MTSKAEELWENYAIDELIEWLKSDVKAHANYGHILDSLRAHKAIMEAERPEPVATVYDAYDSTGIDWHCKDAPPTGMKIYGPALLDYADRMRVERDDALKALDEAQSRLAGIADTISSARRNVNPFDDPRLDYLGDDMREAIWTLSYTANQHKARAETAERQLAELQAKHDALVKDMDRIADWGCDQAEKYDGACAGDIVRLAQSSLAKLNGEGK